MKPQDDYLWGVVYATIAADTGHTVEEIHEALKQQLLTPRLMWIGGVQHCIYTTRTLTTVEMGDYIERCCAWAAGELGISIPAPGEYREETA